MNEYEPIERLEEAVQDVSPVFHNAMLGVFAQIQEQEAKNSSIVKKARSRFTMRTAAIIFIGALFMIGVVMVASLVLGTH